MIPPTAGCSPDLNSPRLCRTLFIQHYALHYVNYIPHLYHTGVKNVDVNTAGLRIHARCRTTLIPRAFCGVYYTLRLRRRSVGYSVDCVLAVGPSGYGVQTFGCPGRWATHSLRSCVTSIHFTTLPVTTVRCTPARHRLWCFASPS